MANSGSARHHLDLIGALAPMFALERTTRSGTGVSRGSVTGCYVEVTEGPPLQVVLLFGTGTRSTAHVHSAVAVAMLASGLGVDLTPWLTQEIGTRGLASRWVARRRFGIVRVAAEHLCEDAILLTVKVDSREEQQQPRVST